MGYAIPTTPQELADIINKIIPQLAAKVPNGGSGGGDAHDITLTVSLAEASRFKDGSMGRVNSFDASGGPGYFQLRNQGILRELETLCKLMGGNSYDPFCESGAQSRLDHGSGDLIPFIYIFGSGRSEGEPKERLFLGNGVALRVAMREKLTTFVGNIDDILYGLAYLGMSINQVTARREAEQVAKSLQPAFGLQARKL